MRAGGGKYQRQSWTTAKANVVSNLPLLERTLREMLDDDALRITAETELAAIEGFDSVTKIKLVLALEESLGVRFTTEEVATARTAGDLLCAIAGHQGPHA